MKCDAVRQHLMAPSEPIDEYALERHIEECEECAALLLDGPLPKVAIEPTELDALLEASSAQLTSERGVAAWLRERPTPQRNALAALAAVLTLSVAWFAVRRIDIQVYPTARMLLALGTLTVVGMATLAAALRPLFNPERPGLRLFGLIGGLVLPVVLALLPMAHTAHPASLVGAGDDLVRKALACFAFGTAFVLPLAALLVLLDRHSRRGRTLLLSVVTGGLVANAVLQLHCPITHSVHLFWGHATIGIVGAAVGFAVIWFLERRPRRDS